MSTISFRSWDVRGIVPAMEGMRYSWLTERQIWSCHSVGDSFYNGSTEMLGEQDARLIRKLIQAGEPHSKALWHIDAWIQIRATRYWWQQFVTHRVGMDYMSASTMHTAMRGLELSDFIVGTPIESIRICQRLVKQGDFERLKRALPEGFLQSRMVKVSYATLRRIAKQRITHRLAEWQDLIAEVALLPYANELILQDIDLSGLEGHTRGIVTVADKSKLVQEADEINERINELTSLFRDADEETVKEIRQRCKDENIVQMFLKWLGLEEK